ncbi:MAG: AlpA family transcriptional regulator [Rhodovulum sulfidophilum]|uniref:AlpA family transcriptional regulator n=1 Tax=Rhodovulum sulfidophilum TaxID=35806 RepID=A0A2W5MZD0_RHOSU|nr:MAG: AlpA family transcriptional regulator [Rhodovulum sulfidophilum]
MSNTPSALVPVKRVATMLSVSVATVWRWCAAGGFPAPLKIGPNATRWRVSDVEAWLASRGTPGE